MDDFYQLGGNISHFDHNKSIFNDIYQHKTHLMHARKLRVNK